MCRAFRWHGFLCYGPNVSNNPARDVQVRFDCKNVDLAQLKYLKEMQEKFSKGNIPHLSPGQKYKHLIQASKGDFDIDQTVTVQLSFLDIEDSRHEARIDWNVSRLRGSIINDEMRDFHRDVPRRLKEISASLKEVAKRTRG